ncbi:MAG: hypothetical protein HDR48_03320 [Bacteroides sp.]|nr:hypothetical protein [Bacteroides sp.]
MLKFRILSVLGLLLPLSFGIRAEERGCDVAAAMQGVSRPVIGKYGMAIGGSSIVSTYLSPVEYTGMRLSIGGEWDKVAPFAGGRLKMHFEGNVGGVWSLLNPAATASMQEIDVDFSWTLERLWRFPHNFTFSAGGGIMAEGGAAALLKNSNNPVAVNIAAAVNARCEGTWQTHISRLPMLMRVGMRMPLVGAFFMPEYGETFYEIYLGNRRGLVHALYPGNYPEINLKAAVALDFGRTAMEVGYMLQWRRTSANHLIERVADNMFFINIIPGGMGLKSKKKCCGKVCYPY